MAVVVEVRVQVIQMGIGLKSDWRQERVWVSEGSTSEKEIDWEPEDWAMIWSFEREVVKIGAWFTAVIVIMH